MIPVVPAIIPKSQADLQDKLTTLVFSPEIHVDVVDGKFTSGASWPCDPTGDPAALKLYLDDFTLEVDMMVVNPLPVAVDWITAGADMLVFHIETIDLDNFKSFADFTHVTTSVACHGDTPITTLLSYAEYADAIQLMGIKEIGTQGQPFLESVLEAIKTVKQAYPDKPITVDGSINTDTIAKVIAAGADRVIVGSAITLQPNPYQAYRALQALIK